LLGAERQTGAFALWYARSLPNFGGAMSEIRGALLDDFFVPILIID
jgi:hypothetical protein